MTVSAERARLRRALEEHVSQLGYSCDYTSGPVGLEPEIVRISPVRRRIAYGETVLRADLGRKACHERLVFFSQRRTRRRSSILFFIGVAAADQTALENLLVTLDVRTGIRGGHVHVVPVEPARPVAKEPAARRRTPSTRRTTTRATKAR